MRFLDEVRISVRAGDGGNGCLSFCRERFKPRGAPDGGDGGRGGDIVLRAVANLNTLVDFSARKNYAAKPGAAGGSKNKHGRSAKIMELEVPPGTEVYDEESDTILGDLKQAGDSLCVARGGKGGLGNAHFKSGSNRSPQRVLAGDAGEVRNLRLVLSVLADVGLLGKPNVGKSSLLAALSAARPKIGDYAFTTLWPNLGVVSVFTGRSYVIADIPGLLPGAASGVGLGTRFLKHLNRTSLLLHVLDIGAEETLEEQIHTIERELHEYSEDLAGRPAWLVLNKSDLLSEDETERRVRTLRESKFGERKSFVVSAVARTGLDALNEAVISWMDEHKPGSGDDGESGFNSDGDYMKLDSGYSS